VVSGPHFKVLDAFGNSIEDGYDLERAHPTIKLTEMLKGDVLR
jgi:hypothetical protein